MEFLLLSQKKHRTWVIFKQLLLLLLRMAAIALVVLALAQPLLAGPLGQLSRRAAHASYRNPRRQFFDVREFGLPDGLRAGQEGDFNRLGDSLTRPREPQTFTLLRLSRGRRPLWRHPA